MKSKERIKKKRRIETAITQVAAAAVKSLQSCPTLCDPRWQPIRLHCPWDSPGTNTGTFTSPRSKWPKV